MQTRKQTDQAVYPQLSGERLPSERRSTPSPTTVVLQSETSDPGTIRAFADQLVVPLLVEQFLAQVPVGLQGITVEADVRTSGRHGKEGAGLART